MSRVVGRDQLSNNQESIKIYGRNENENVANGNKYEIHNIPINLIIPDPNQPRKSFDEKTIKELADSISTHGLVEPIIVKPLEDGRFQIISGERRFRACQLIDLSHIICVVRNDLSDAEIKELQLIENIQREDLTPIEEALAFKELIDKYGHTHEQLATKIGKSRSYISNKLRLLRLSSEIKGALEKGEISEGHARAILSVAPEHHTHVFKEIIEKGLTVREAEKLARESESVSCETCDDSSELISVRTLKVVSLILDENGNLKDDVSKDDLMLALIEDLKELRR